MTARLQLRRLRVLPRRLERVRLPVLAVVLARLAVRAAQAARQQVPAVQAVVLAARAVLQQEAARPQVRADVLLAVRVVRRLDEVLQAPVRAAAAFPERFS